MPKRKTQEEFVQEVKTIFGNEYTILGEYVNNKTNILVRHNKCGNEFNKIPKDMTTKKSGCPYCNGNKNKLYNEQWVITNTPLPYHYVKGYKGMKTKCTFHCNKCGIDFEQLPSRLINQGIYGCNCCPTKKKTHEQFLTELGEDFLKHYSVDENYINIDTKISFTHKDCGTTFKLEPYKLIYEYHKEYCPICYYKKSKGEVKIYKYLSEHNIEFLKEYVFKDFLNARYDFYLPKENVCIEFDGKQHFEYIPFFDNYNQQERDQNKNEYCISHNIILYRIPYTDVDNIEFILDKIFKEKSSETIEKYRVY